MRLTWQIWQRSWWVRTAILLFLAVPQTASAHGELLIRIAETTSKIESATNNFAQLHLERGELYREDQNWTAAASDYDRAAQLDPNLPVDLCRAKMLDDSGQLEPARVMFGKVLAGNPKDGEAFIGRARVLVKLGNPKMALKDFRRGIELLGAASKPDYYLEFARTFKAEGNTDDALRTLDEGMNIFGNLVTLQGYALDLELERENHDAALARLDTIIKDAPRKENWLARKGDILLELGQSVEARKAYEAALAAVKLLPSILQKAPPLQKLQLHIHAALAEITNAPTASKPELILNAKNEN